ncbi:diguanylate cyclase [Budviciaceae bacterium CWB-B4]|uniref:diguanylate cyclase n=1 Tax=Limnobaculum xujianqingii TaxID=2738837 RepID=A0A9D7FVR9_9GAMM|nr:diguanylate cyclase [Limnobaculum xujianqingii]MBK5074507.1 diguanylate cyclase [Limnobaculum xujianqingii]MBK5177827.1 diguanylate cyclase [Limnobaculum xujianqingii]
MFFDGVIINISIVLTGFYFISKLSKLPLDAALPLGKQIQIGLCNGLLCFTLMKFSIPTINHTLIDLRHIPLIVAACYIGPVPTLITALIISVSRVVINFNDTALIVSVFYAFLGIVLAFCSHYIRKSLRYRAALFSIITVVFICIAYAIATQNVAKIIKFTFLMTLFSTIGMLLSLMLLKDLKQRKIEMLTYQGLAQQDFLTSLLNRRMFDQAIQSINLSKQNVVLMLMDVDYFKQINDQHGHDAGDRVLRDIAHILDSYTAYGQKTFRIGGEEFSAILIDCPIPLAKKIAEDICRKVESHACVLANGEVIHATISIGISGSGPNYNKNSLSLFRRADRALYQAKSDGRNRISYASDDIYHDPNSA